MEKIGVKLKQQRQSKRLTHEDINAAIRTPIKFLAALEDDDISVFPAELYYIGSLRRYATFLGLDANELVGAYKQNKVVVVQEALPKKEERLSGKYSAKLWIPALTVIAVIVIAVFVRNSLKVSEAPESIPVSPVSVQQPVEQETKKPPEPVPQPKVVKHQEQAKVEKKSLAVKEEVKRTAAAENNKKYDLEVEAVSNCWVKVTTDGNMVFSATLEKGSKKQWYADNELGLVIGYVPGLRVKLNGKDLDITSGAKQDLNELHFKADESNNAR